MNACPSEGQLRRLGAESMDSATYEAIVNHVECCSDCADVLERIADESPAAGAPEPSPLPEKGQYPVIAGFEIKAELGRGGMGVVYLAWQPKLGRDVALKVMPPAPGAENSIRRKCYAEARAFSRLSHANVVGIHDVGEEYPWFYLVLDYVPGGSLKDRLDGPLKPRDAARLAASIAETVHAIHEAGLLHLDLKPANIMLAGSREASWDAVLPKVSGCGVSRLLSQSQTTGGGPSLSGVCAGTPSYMAPEQICGDPKKLGRAADIHALGAILYELLTGRPPFQGASTVETVDQIRTQEPVRPTRLRRHIPRDLEVITLKCLEKVPPRRYSSAAELAEDLRRWLDGRPIQARPVSPAQHGWRWCRRQPVVAGLAGALAGTVTAALLGLSFLYRSADRQRLRAETAREAAERNLEIACTVTDHLERLVMNVLLGSEPLEADRLENTMNVLRKQIARAKMMPGFNHQLLAQLIPINEVLAERLRDLGRSSEALAITTETIDLTHECQELDSENETHPWHMVALLAQAGSIELDAERSEPALAYFDRATNLLEACSSANMRQSHAALLSNAYLRLGNRLARDGRPEVAKRANVGQLKMLSLVANVDPDTPDLLLVKACVLVDHGEWDRARGVIRALCSRKHSGPVVSQHRVETALVQWVMREIRHWDFSHEGREIDRDASDREVDGILGIATEVYAAQGMRWTPSGGAMGGVRDGVAKLAAKWRKAGQLDEADRSVALLTALAQRLVREFPDDPVSYLVLSEAFAQQSKNAWPRHDLPTIRQALSESIDALRRALAIDPGRLDYQQILRDRKARLARVH